MKTTDAPKRAVEEKERRRRRDGDDATRNMRLSVKADTMDPNYAYRWLNDESGRMHQATIQDDWDVVTDPSAKEDATGLGSGISCKVGVSADGTPLTAYLARKKKVWYEADEAKKQDAHKETDETLNRDGILLSKEVQESGAENFYKPS